MMPPIKMSPAEMKEAAKEGAFIEFVYNEVIGPRSVVSLADCAAAIRAVGIDHCVLSSDLGQPHNPLHLEGLEILFAELRKEGFAVADIERMSKQNPAELLGLGNERRNRE
jgi:microsomal dipeptidase-like Zn-dependent dipeptidase